MTSANDAIEAPTRIEPARLEETLEPITDVIAELSSASAVLGARLHPATAASLADLVRLMNCCYSNLIEGHRTAPRDIERLSPGIWLGTRAGAISRSKRLPMFVSKGRSIDWLPRVGCLNPRLAHSSAGFTPSSIAMRPRRC